MNEIKQRQLLSALSHGSIFFSSLILPIVIPIVILIVFDDPIVKKNAKQAINFSINILIYFLLLGLCYLIYFFFVFSIDPFSSSSVNFPPLFGILGILVSIFSLITFFIIIISFVLPIIAVFKILNNSNYIYRYPLIFRFVK
jgi:uncharacterized protein